MITHRPTAPTATIGVQTGVACTTRITRTHPANHNAHIPNTHGYGITSPLAT